MLRFTSLIIDNFGPFKGCQTIDFTDANGVTFIWGNNGRGKTTLLNIFRYALFGRFQNRRKIDVDLTALSNIEGRADGNYNFKVILKMQNDAKHYELTRQYLVRKGIDKPTKNDDYEEKIFLKEDGSLLSPDSRDHVLNLIMPQEVSRFFLFDGELLQEYEELLMDETDDGTRIKNSIEQILGVPVLTNGAIDVGAILNDYRKEKNRIAQSNAQTQRIAAQIEALEAEKTEHTAELNRLNVELSAEYQIKAGLENDAQQNEHVSALLQSMDALESNIAEKAVRKANTLAQIIAATGDAWKGLITSRVDVILSHIAEQLSALESKENSQRIAEHILQDMKTAIDSKHCSFCEQNIDAEHLDKLLTKVHTASSEYSGLSKDENALLQQLRMRQATLLGIKSPGKKDVLDILEGQLATLEIETDDANRQLKTVREELERHGDIESLSSGAQENIKALALCLKKIDNFRDGCQKEREKIKEVESALSVLEDKLNRVSTDVEMQVALRKLELCEQVSSIFENGIAAYRDKLKGDVERDATDLFLHISNDPDYASLQINENYGLSIVHKSGTIVPLRSAGYEHVVALALIGALHKNAPLRGPIIMDSPFGRLDPTHKSNITKALPNMSEQIVLLAYTREIDEQYARGALGSTLKKEYLLQRISSFHTQIEAQ